MWKDNFDWGDFWYNTFFILMVILCIGAVALLITAEVTHKEIDSFTFVAEITHLDKVAFNRQRSSSRANYSASVYNGDWFSYTFNVSSSDYAKYQEGDMVEIKSITTQNIFKQKITNYELIGVVKNGI